MLRFTWPMRRSRSILMVAMCPPFRNELNRSVLHPAELHAFDDVAVQHVGLVDSIRMRDVKQAAPRPSAGSQADDHEADRPTRRPLAEHRITRPQRCSINRAGRRRSAKATSADPAALSRRTRFHCPTAQGACMSTPPSSGPYAIGVDFGTESGRAVLVDVRTGAELASAVYPYANGVIDSSLPSSGARLPPEWALQDPADYLRTFTTTIPDILNRRAWQPKM